MRIFFINVYLWSCGLICGKLICVINRINYFSHLNTAAAAREQEDDILYLDMLEAELAEIAADQADMDIAMREMADLHIAARDEAQTESEDDAYDSDATLPYSVSSGNTHF